MLRLSENADWWEAAVAVRGRAVGFKIGGDAEPSLELIAHAHDIVRAWADFERMVTEFLAGEASRQRQYAEEIRRLVVEEVCLFWPERPDDGMIYFSGPDEFRVWRCDYVGRKLKGLGFDS
jgi:hypothetical protein